MLRASLSVLGLYSYNNDIFNGLELPAGLDKEILVDNLLEQLSAFEIVYPDADFMEAFLPRWSRMRMPVWEEMLETTMFEYDPIANYDRKEEYDETGSAESAAHSFVAGFNDTDLQENANADNTGSNTLHRESHISGNVGATTTQSLIEEQRKVVQFSVYQFIIDDFKKHFCITVY